MKSVFSFLACSALLASTAFAQSFSTSVAVSGDQLIAGGSSNDISPGALYVYTQSADGNWEESAILAASEGGEAGDNFGRSVSVYDRWMAVGAPGTNSVFFFEKSETGSWSQVGRLQESEIEGFGGRVVMEGDHLLVAVSGGRRSAGSVYAYTWVDGAWSARGMLAPDTEEEVNGFPSAMALGGGHAIIGGSRANEGTGAVWAFKFDSESSSWQANGSPSAPFVAEGSSFGSSILIVGTHLGIGMPGHDRRIGAVAGFDLNEESGEWDFSNRIAPFSAGTGASFGSSLAFGGASVYVGAPGDGSGRLYAFPVDEDGIVGISSLAATGLDARASFGASVAVGDGVAVVGATGQDRAGVAVPFAIADGEWIQGNSVYHDAAGHASVTGGMVECVDDAAGAYECKDINMDSYLNQEDMGGERGTMTNDIWGWEDPETGREYALVGFIDQTSFVDVTDSESPIYLGRLRLTEGARAAAWRDMKVYKDHAYIVADGAGQHGMQVFDLRQLRDFDGTPRDFEVTAYYDKIASSHNIVINEETGFAYAVGSRMGGETCGGGLHMIDLNEPANPTFAGCFADGSSGRAGTGYSHDAQCVIYRGPDSDHAGKEICLGSNETALSIADVTDKANPVTISIASYPNVAYAHQGWLTDDHRFFYMNDEGDEPQGLVEGTRTLVWDLQDLDEPQLVAEHIATTTTTDHNLYVKGDLMYQSNYGSGFRILDISDRAAPVEVGYFVTSPNGGGGSWSNYPYFKSGTMIVTDMSGGLFVLRQKNIDT